MNQKIWPTLSLHNMVLGMVANGIREKKKLGDVIIWKEGKFIICKWHCICEKGKRINQNIIVSNEISVW